MVRILASFFGSNPEDYNSEKYTGVDPAKKIGNKARLVSMFSCFNSKVHTPDLHTGADPTIMDATAIIANLNHENEHNRNAARLYYRHQMCPQPGRVLPRNATDRKRDAWRVEARRRRHSPIWNLLRKATPWISLAIVETILILILTLRRKAAVAVGASACVAAAIIFGFVAWRLWEKDNETPAWKTTRWLIADDVMKETELRFNDRNREKNARTNRDLEMGLFVRGRNEESNVVRTGDDEKYGGKGSVVDTEGMGTASFETAEVEKESGIVVDSDYVAAMAPAHEAEPENLPSVEKSAIQMVEGRTDDGPSLQRESAMREPESVVPEGKLGRTHTTARKHKKARDWANRSQHDKKIKGWNYGRPISQPQSRIVVRQHRVPSRAFNKSTSSNQQPSGAQRLLEDAEQRQGRETMQQHSASPALDSTPRGSDVKCARPGTPSTYAELVGDARNPRSPRNSILQRPKPPTTDRKWDLCRRNSHASLSTSESPNYAPPFPERESLLLRNFNLVPRLHVHNVVKLSGSSYIRNSAVPDPLFAVRGREPPLSDVRPQELQAERSLHDEKYIDGVTRRSSRTGLGKPTNYSAHHDQKDLREALISTTDEKYLMARPVHSDHGPSEIPTTSAAREYGDVPHAPVQRMKQNANVWGGLWRNIGMDEEEAQAVQLQQWEVEPQQQELDVEDSVSPCSEIQPSDETEGSEHDNVMVQESLVGSRQRYRLSSAQLGDEFPGEALLWEIYG